MSAAADARAPERPAGRQRAGRTALAALGTLLALAAVAAFAWHVSAVSAYQASFDTHRTLAERAASAKRAAAFEPFEARFALRAHVMSLWETGDSEFARADYLHAMLTLAEAYKLDVGDKALLADFQKAQQELTLHTNFKAHLQHAHEGPGGTLRPQDVVP